MKEQETLYEYLARQGVSRRAFLKFCAITASSLALTASQTKSFAQVLAGTPRPSVIWLSFQECTGCTESLTRSFDPTVENLILNHLSLDYHHTLQAAAGTAAEAARHTAMQDFFGNYVVVVDGAIPTGAREAYSTIAGVSNLQMLRETLEGAALVIAVGTCATFGGLPAAAPNPSTATGVQALMTQGLVPTRPLINVSGCPPVPEVISGTIAYYLVFGTLPALDSLRRPQVYFGKTVHDCCTRLPHFRAGRFALTFDDEGARRGYCLMMVGCKGPDTRNACATVRWNERTSFPMHSGHGCLGCSQPGFWDRAGGFYGVISSAGQGNTTGCTIPVQPPLP